jgi:hypothetical protein
LWTGFEASSREIQEYHVSLGRRKGHAAFFQDPERGEIAPDRSKIAFRAVFGVGSDAEFA